ncbi:MAG: hypothetical protein D6775_05925 [Caldilineae bacterium]|nr:MAG: hypothetical protein D6775_05925 [Caldilineae bacterium]
MSQRTAAFVAVSLTAFIVIATVVVLLAMPGLRQAEAKLTDTATTAQTEVVQVEPAAVSSQADVLPQANPVAVDASTTQDTAAPAANTQMLEVFQQREEAYRQQIEQANTQLKQAYEQLQKLQAQNQELLQREQVYRQRLEESNQIIQTLQTQLNQVQGQIAFQEQVTAPRDDDRYERERGYDDRYEHERGEHEREYDDD